MVAQQQPIVGENNMENNVKNNSNNMLLMINKGKRTKRARPLSPLLSLTMSTSTATEDGSGSGSGEWTVDNLTVSEEEEDMAHCLILLAQGSNNHQYNSITNNNNNRNCKANNGTTSYECKTCNKSYPSFQALGGHRASHKKPKLCVAEKSPLVFSILRDDNLSLTLQMANTNTNTNTNTAPVITKTKVHECSICGAEFSSGQALGGHMRRHRPLGTSSSLPSHPGAAVKMVSLEETAVTNPTKNILSLDLNLPAPEEDYIHRNFVFPSNEKTLVFTAPSLVDCHY